MVTRTFVQAISVFYARNVLRSAVKHVPFKGGGFDGTTVATIERLKRTPGGSEQVGPSAEPPNRASAGKPPLWSSAFDCICPAERPARTRRRTYRANGLAP